MMTGLDAADEKKAPPDPRQLPHAAREAFDRVKNRCPVHFEALGLDGAALHLLTVRDISTLIKGDPFRNTAEFPFWAKLWEAAVVLATFLSRQRPAPGTTLLELGAGQGLPALAAARTGFKTVASDLDPLVCDVLAVNAAANRLDVACLCLDWLDPPAVDERFQVIAGAEVLFHEDFFQPLLSVLDRFLAPGGVVYLAHDARRQSLAPFLHLAEEKFQIAAQRQDIRRPGGEPVTVLLHRLRQRS